VRSGAANEVFGYAGKQIWRLIDGAKHHLAENGSWFYRLSEIYFTAEVTPARSMKRTESCEILTG